MIVEITPATPGVRVGVVALLVDARGGVPAPIDEDRGQQALGERARPAEVRSGVSHERLGVTEPGMLPSYAL